MTARVAYYTHRQTNQVDDSVRLARAKKVTFTPPEAAVTNIFRRLFHGNFDGEKYVDDIVEMEKRVDEVTTVDKWWSRNRPLLIT